jgi:hypothetical protein
MARPNDAHPQAPSLSTVLGLSGGDEIELALNMRAARGDLRAIGLLRQSRLQRQVPPIDLGRLETADDLVQAQSIILRAAARGEISAGDAKKLGDQVDLLGQALERDQLARKIKELSAKVGSTKEAAVSKRIEEQVAPLEIKVLSYLKKEEQSWEEYTEKYGTGAVEVLIATHILGFLYLLSGMEHLDFLRLGADNHLPRAMQEIFDTCDEFARFKEPPASPTSRRYKSRYHQPDRWKPSGWSCTCRNTSTLWVDSDLRLPDRIQIYCAACHKLAGWGTREEFDRAFEDGQASGVERSEVEIVAKFKPAPVIGVQAYLKAKNIRAVIGHPDAEGDGIILTQAKEDAL